MSFRDQHNQYSPYYLPLSIEQDGLRAGASEGSTYQPASYHPLSTHRNRPSQSITQDTSASSSFHGDQGYENKRSVGNAGNLTAYDSRNGYRTEVSAVDTTNLGNLAYASSLSRAAASSQQDHFPKNSSQYGLNVTEPVSRGESRTTTGKATDLSRRLPSTHAQYPSQSHHTNTGRNSQTQSRYSVYNPSHQPSRHCTPTQQIPESVRTRNGQENTKRHSGDVSKSTPSPVLVPVQDTSFQSAGHHSGGGQGQLQHQLYKTDSSTAYDLNGFDTSARPQQQTTTDSQERGAAEPSGISQSSNITNTHRPAPGMTSQAYQRSPLSNIHEQIQRQQSPQSTPIQEQYPTTVDPRQVFDDIEYRRKKEEEIEKRQTVDAARNSALAKNQSLQAGLLERATLHVSSLQSNNVSEAAASANQGQKGSESTAKDQMELEMKQMIEKMRDYKAKDPSLFSQIWEQVKKGQAPQTRSTKPITQRSSTSPTVANVQLNSPLLSKHHTESESSAASSFPPSFDQGRFPNQHRRRGSLISAGYNRSKSHHKVPIPSSEPPPNLTFQHTLKPSTEQPPSPKSQHTVKPSTEQPPSPIPQVSAAPSTGKNPDFPPRAAAPYPNSGALVAQMMPSKSDDTDRRLIVAMQNFHQSPAVSTPPPVRPGLPPSNALDPGLSETTTSTPTPAQSVRPMARPFKGKTQWPENQKRALAEAAVTFLTWNPSNAGKQINAAEIHELLNQNPSYTEICEILDYRGFVVERGHFARFLLNAVPHMGSVSSSATTAPPASPLATTHQQQSSSHNGQKSLEQNIHGPAKDQPGMHPQRVHLSGRSLSDPSVVPKPPTKEDKARKRKFSDIVDLTQVLSEDEDIVLHPKSRTGNHAIDPPIDPAKMTVSRKDGPSSDGSQATKQEARALSKTREHVFKEQVSEPMNKQRDARRCSSYDPKTIARDILISSGRHPTMAPLNYHLDILREKFDSVNKDTDLSTFRWDIVDPLDKAFKDAAALATLTDIMNQPGVNEDEDGESIHSLMINSAGKAGPSKSPGRPIKKSDQNAIGYTNSLGLRNSQQSERISLARDGRVSSGPVMVKFRLPKKALDTSSISRSHQQQFNPMGQIQVPNQSHGIKPDRLHSRENHRGISPSFAFTPVSTSHFSPSAGNAIKPPTSLSQAAPSPGARCLRCRKQDSRCDSQKPCSRCITAGISVEHCIFEEGSQGNVTPGSGQRRAGRPPGAKNRRPRPDKGIPKSPKTPSVLLSGRIGPPSAKKPSPQRSSETGGFLSPANRVAVVIQKPSPNVEGKGKRHQSTDFDNPEVPGHVYRSYKCNWDQCPAELHNLETLRKHVRKHRKGLEGPIPCRMPGCGHIDGVDLGAWMTFENGETWDTHVEEAHIRPLETRDNELSGDSNEDSNN